MIDLFGEEDDTLPNVVVKKWGMKLPRGTNPLISLYGTTEGKKCGACGHHYFVVASRYYPKCELRKFSHSQKSDHSSRLPACGKFIQREK